MNRRVKPFTLFLCIFILAYLILGTKILFIDSETNKSEGKIDSEARLWTGIISLWDIPYVETGIASNLSWLNSIISEFERENPGVFIDVRRMTPQRAEMYFSGNIDREILPDIISIPTYEDFVPSNMYEDLGKYFDEHDLQRLETLALNHILNGETIRGVPTMMGTYALFTNKDLLAEQGILFEEDELDYSALNNIVEKASHTIKERKKEIYYYGFGSYNSHYSKPIISMIYNASGKIQDDKGYYNIKSWQQSPNVLFGDMWELDSLTSLRSFINNERIGVFLGNTQALYRARRLIEAGKGFELGVYCLPIDGKDGLFQDQLASYGLIKSDDSIKKDYCLSFLKSLLTETAQIALEKVGMFPIVNDVGYIYADDPEMHLLEKYNNNFTFGPHDSYWIDKQQKTMEMLRELEGAKQDFPE